MRFDECSDEVAKDYVMFENASYWIYPILLKEELRVWVYSGDVDADVPTPGTIHWLEKLREDLGLPV